MKLATVNISEILIGERIRKEFEDSNEGSSLERLANDMKKHEIIQPIAVKETEHGYLLIAGERRIKAARIAGIEDIPIRIYDSDITTLEMQEIELSENLWRKDFTPVEKANAYAAMHKLQVEIHGEKISTNPDAEGQSIKDTADMIGVSKSLVSEAISLAETMEMFPDMGWEDTKTTADAMKLKKRLETGLVRRELVKRAKASIGDEDSARKRLVDSYIVRDFFEGVDKVPNNTFDFVEIDPPYAIDLKNVKKQDGGTTTGLSVYNEIDPKKYPAFMKHVFSQCYRTMKSDSWLICWFGPEPWFESIYQWMLGAGFKSTRLVGVWIKGGGQTLQPAKRLANSVELFFYAWKGSPDLYRPGMNVEFHYPPIAPAKKSHPTERPIEMIQDILTTFAAPGSKVLVPFAGSGNTGIAAAKELMTPILFDLESSYKDGYTIKVEEML